MKNSQKAAIGEKERSEKKTGDKGNNAAKKKR